MANGRNLFLGLVATSSLLLFVFYFNISRFTKETKFTGIENSISESSLAGVCKIPKINPSDVKAHRLIADDEKGKGTPKCFDLEENRRVKFVVDDTTSSLIKLDQNSSFWTDVTCCYVGFEQSEMNYADFFPEEVSSKKKRKKARTISSTTSTQSPLFASEECVQITAFSTEILEQYEFVDVECRRRIVGGKASQNETDTTEIFKTIYEDQFLFLRLNPLKEQLSISKFQSRDPNRDLLNILFIGLDSVSFANFERFMPKTRDYLLSKLSAFEFTGRNKISSGTQGNLLPAITGCKLSKNSNNPESYSDNCTLIWEHFAELGYRTFRSEDDFGLYKSFYPTLKKGNTGLPNTDYDWLRYIHRMKKRNKNYGNQYTFGCFDHQWVHHLLLNRTAEVAKHFGPNNRDSPWFNFIWSATATHDMIGFARYMDEPLSQLFQDLHVNNLLNNTVLVFMSDHGMLYGSYSRTYEGSIEGRMPFLYLAFPDWFREKYPLAMEQMGRNVDRLTTPFDLHETLLDLLDVENRISNKVLQSRLVRPSKNNGITLFQSISSMRTCESANIPAEWCICWDKTLISNPSSDTNIVKIVNFAVKFLNEKLSEYSKCAQLVLDKILSGRKVNSGRMKVEGKGKPPKNYEIIFETAPSQALFEVNAVISDKDEIRFIGDVLRVSAYGSQSSCLHMDVGGSSSGWISSVCYCV